MPTYSVIDTGSGADTFYEGMVKDAANWAILEALVVVGTTASQTLTNKTLTTPIINCGSDATGDMYYRVGTTFTRLAKGTARQGLSMNSGASAPEWVASLASLFTAQADIVYASAANTPAALAKGAANTKLFINAGATAPEWAVGHSMIAAARDNEGGTGDVNYTGVGFLPSMIIALCGSATEVGAASIGVATGAGGNCIYNKENVTASWWPSSAVQLIIATESDTKNQSAVLKTFNADGFTLTWTRTGVTQAGTIEVFFICFR
jgi:hypothetical protein